MQDAFLRKEAKTRSGKTRAGAARTPANVARAVLLLEGGGFTLLGKRKGRAIYELVVSQASTPLLKPYKAALAEYKTHKANEQGDAI